MLLGAHTEMQQAAETTTPRERGGTVMLLRAQGFCHSVARPFRCALQAHSGPRLRVAPGGYASLCRWVGAIPPWMGL